MEKKLPVGGATRKMLTYTDDIVLLEKGRVH